MTTMTSEAESRRGAEIVIADIIFDCTDPEAVAAFWSALLGRPVAGRRGPYVWLTRGIDQPGMGFQRVDDVKSVKNRVHLDISGSDVRSTRARVEQLGGRRVQGYEEGGFVVMADPEGNEFCVVPREPFDLDELGRTSYQES